MKFPQILLAFAALLIACAIETGCGGSSYGGNHPITPPPPPTGTNYTTCASQQVPNWQSNLFISNYQPAISAVVQHYGSSTGYIRVGLGKGGEINLPQGWDNSSSGACYGGYSGKWNYTAGSPSSTWNAYLASMVQFEGGLGSASPLLVSITPITDIGTEPDDFIAQVAVQSGLSFGNQGLESSDMSGSCGGDWCNLFAQYPHSSASPIRELQTLGQSCPNGTSCANSLAQSTGDLTPLLPFATSHGANDLELYYQDWLIAFDPDYANSVGASNATAGYAAAIQAAAATGAHMQVLFPPQQTDSTTCGSLGCFQAVQQYLINNSQAPITGVVIDVDWSDFQPNNATDSPDWTITDAAIAPYSSKQINLVLQNTTYGGSGSCPSVGIGSNGNVANNCAMPAWMWTVLQ